MMFPFEAPTVVFRYATQSCDHWDVIVMLVVVVGSGHVMYAPPT